MTDSEIRKALRAIHRTGVPWQEIAHRVNLLAGDRRVVTMDTIRRYVVENRAARPATLYWVERWLSKEAASAAVAR